MYSLGRPFSVRRSPSVVVILGSAAYAWDGMRSCSPLSSAALQECSFKPRGSVVRVWRWLTARGEKRRRQDGGKGGSCFCVGVFVFSMSHHAAGWFSSCRARGANLGQCRINMCLFERNVFFLNMSSPPRFCRFVDSPLTAALLSVFC